MDSDEFLALIQGLVPELEVKKTFNQDLLVGNNGQGYRGELVVWLYEGYVRIGCVVETHFELADPECFEKLRAYLLEWAS